MTDYGRELEEHSESGVYQYLREAIDEMTRPFNQSVFRFRDLKDETSHKELTRHNDKAISNALLKIGWVKFRKQKNKKPTLTGWIMREHQQKITDMEYDKVRDLLDGESLIKGTDV